jgi:hypothetical protein
MRVDESWQARVCMRVFSTFVLRSKKNKSCMRVDKSAQELMRVGKREFACMRVFSTFVPRSKENKSCMRVDKSWRSNTNSRPHSTEALLSRTAEEPTNITVFIKTVYVADFGA